MSGCSFFLVFLSSNHRLKMKILDFEVIQFRVSETPEMYNYREMQKCLNFWTYEHRISLKMTFLITWSILVKADDGWLQCCLPVNQQSSKVLKYFTASLLHQGKRSAAVCERCSDLDSERKKEKEEKMQSLTCISQLCSMGANHCSEMWPWRMSSGPSAYSLFKRLGTEIRQEPREPLEPAMTYLPVHCSHCATLVRVIGALRVFWHCMLPCSVPSPSAEEIPECLAFVWCYWSFTAFRRQNFNEFLFTTCHRSVITSRFHWRSLLLLRLALWSKKRAAGFSNDFFWSGWYLFCYRYCLNWQLAS